MARCRPHNLAGKGNRFEKIKGKKPSEMNLFELSIIGAMREDIYQEIRRQAVQALMHLEDGAGETAAAVLRKFLDK